MSSRELVEAALRRAEELQAALNCFVSIDAERALAAADDGVGRRPAAVRRGAHRGQGHHRLGPPHADHGLRPVRRLRARLPLPRRAAAGGVGAGVDRPDHGARAGDRQRDRGPALRAHAQPVGPVAHAGRVQRRRGGGGGRRRVLDRPRLGRRRVAPHPGGLLRAGGPEAQRAGGCRRARCWASRCWSRTACSPARWPTPPRRSTCSPATSWATPAGRLRRPSPSPTAARRDPGSLRIGVALDGPIDAPLDPECERGVREAAELLSSLGHSVEEVDPPWVGGNLLPTFMKLWAVNISAGVVRGAQVTGREPSPELVEPLTWWLYEQGRAAERDRLLAGGGRAAGLGAVDHHHAVGLARRDPPPHAGPAAAEHRRAGHLQRRPGRRLPPLGPVHPAHGAVQRERPAGDLAAAVPGRGRPAHRRCSSPAPRRARPCCSRSPPS